MIRDIGIDAISGELDVPSVEAYLGALRFAVPDPREQHTFLLSDSPYGIAMALQAHARGEKPYRVSVAIVSVARARVSIGYAYEALEPLRCFVAWLREHYSVRFSDDDYGGDVHEVDDELEILFGKPEPPFAQTSDDVAYVIANDPHGVADVLVGSLTCGDEGRSLCEPLAKCQVAELRLGPALRASWTAGKWRIARDDTGAAVTMSPEQIEKLVTNALEFRRAFLLQGFPAGLTLDSGRFEIEDHLFGSADRGFYRGQDRQRNVPVLITLGTPQRESVDVVKQRLAYDVPGVAALLHIGPLASAGEARYDGLVEDEPPPGVRAAGWPNLGAVEAAQRGLAVGKTIAAAHARGLVLGGLRPELVFLDGDRVVGITPRCDLFHASMTNPDHGVALCFPHVYFAPEVLARPQDPATAAADVFALAAMIAFWHTGEHPFTGEYSTNAIAIITGQRTPWSADAKLRAIVESGLQPLPGRASLDGLLSALQSVFGGHVEAP